MTRIARPLLAGLTVLVMALLTAWPVSLRAQSEPDLESMTRTFLEHYRTGRYEDALKLAEPGVAIAERRFGATSAIYSIQVNNYALVLREMGRYAEAEPLFKRSVAIFERPENVANPESHLPTVNLATLYWFQGRYAEAEPLYLRAIELAQKNAGPNDPTVALCLNNLGLLYWSQGRFAEAEPRLKEALSIWEKSSGETHQHVALALANLSNVYQAQGRYADAEPLLRRALSISRTRAGPEHPDVAIALNNLGELLRIQNRAAEADEAYRQSLAITEKAFGRKHVNAAMALNNIGETYRALGRYADAEPLYAESLAIREALLGPDHPSVAQSLNNQALNVASQGRIAEAEKLLKRGLVILEKHLGKEHLDVAVTVHNLGLIATVEGRHADAEELLQRSLAIRTRQLPSSHPAMVQSQVGIAFLRDAQGRKEEAEALRKRAAQAPNWEVAEIPILFASNRAHVLTDKGPQFGADQLLDPQRIAIGRAMLRAPKAEVVNRAERNAAALGLLQNAAGRQTSESALLLHDVAIFADGGTAFWADARATLARASRFRSQALVFVHGYNNSFEDAVRRAAMISFDLDFDGVVAAFAWPARSGVTAYMGDRERAQTAAPFLLQMLETIGKALPDVKVHIVSHSTGSEVVLSTLDKLADRAAGGMRPVRLGEVIFAHADVNASRLAQVLPGLRKLGVRLTSYSSREDLAMRASDLIRMDGKRVGGAPVHFEGVDAIDISGLGTRFSLNHSVFVQNPQVFNDMARLMATGARPPHVRTPGLQQVTTPAGTHWEYKALLPPPQSTAKAPPIEPAKEPGKAPAKAKP